LAERLLRRLVGRREEPVTALLRFSVGAVEADEVIDAVAVEEIGAAARALAKPPEILLRHHIPLIERHPPVLPGGAEGVRRRADRDIEPELMLARPDVGAVAVDHERQIAEQLDAVRALARALPLRAGDPLQVLVEDDLARQLAARAMVCRRLGARELGRPLGPPPLPFTRGGGGKRAV